ncbi:serine/arginine repetitive matrix protein 1-like [Achroia grisella]|uniref:serine/arginine repetitive matrix protein 1-like n=1 Tax=Achroia grisella TaxID=688607 RepID=UPI0027D28366|nr:serine/arginine repetitive matrix protein 1-like [Achroia grisella]
MSQRGKDPRTVVRRDLADPTKIVPTTELGTFYSRPAPKGNPSALAGSGNDAADREQGGGQRAAQPGPSKRRTPPSPPIRGDKRRDTEESPPSDLDLERSPPRPQMRLVDRDYQPLSVSSTVRRLSLTPPPPPRSPSPPANSGGEEGREDEYYYGGAYSSPQSPMPTPRALPRSFTLNRGDFDATSYTGIQTDPSTESVPPPVPSPRTRTPPSFAAVAAGPPTPTAGTVNAPVASAPPQPTGSEGPATQAAKYPPIVAERLPNWTRHFTNLTKVLGEAPNARPYGTGFRFLPKSDTEFRAVQKYLVEAGERDPAISWYFYSLASELPTKTAIRGLPADTPIDSIVEALELKGFGVRLVRGIPARRGRPGAVWKPHTANDRKCAVYKREARQRGMKPRPPFPPVPNTVPRAPQRRGIPTATPRTYAAQVPPPAVIVAVVAGACLMAPANEPTQRGAGAAAPKKRRRRRRAKRRTGGEPVKASTPIPTRHVQTATVTEKGPRELTVTTQKQRGPQAAPRRRQAAPPAYNTPIVAAGPLLAGAQNAPPAPPAPQVTRSARRLPATQKTHKRPSTVH